MLLQCLQRFLALAVPYLQLDLYHDLVGHHCPIAESAKRTVAIKLPVEKSHQMITLAINGLQAVSGNDANVRSIHSPSVTRKACDRKGSGA